MKSNKLLYASGWRIRVKEFRAFMSLLLRYIVSFLLNLNVAYFRYIGLDTLVTDFAEVKDPRTTEGIRLKCRILALFHG